MIQVDPKAIAVTPRKTELKEFSGEYYGNTTEFSRFKDLDRRSEEYLPKSFNIKTIVGVFMGDQNMPDFARFKIQIIEKKIKFVFDAFEKGTRELILNESKDYDFNNSVIYFREDIKLRQMREVVVAHGISIRNMKWMLDENRNLVIISGGYGGGSLFYVVPFGAVNQSLVKFDRINR